MKLLVIALLLVAHTVTAQTRPDFSGVWVAVTPQDEEFQTLQVKQDGLTLTEIRGSGGGLHTFTYKLDGTETRTAKPSHDKEIVSVMSAKWEGGSLVLTNVMTFPAGNTAAIRQVWSLDADKQLVTEMTRRTDRDGNTPPKTMKIAYKKK
jgi:hypothetical protein